MIVLCRWCHQQGYMTDSRGVRVVCPVCNGRRCFGSTQETSVTFEKHRQDGGQSPTTVEGSNE